MFENERTFAPKPEKPPVLYHASAVNVNELEPQGRTKRHELDAPRVYATPSKAMASVFLVPTDDSWAASGTIEDQPYLIVSDEERFKALDNGGVMYELDTDQFDPVPDTGDHEWAATEAITPKGVQTIPSALAFMREQGVLVRFVDVTTYQELESDDQKKFAFLSAALTDQNT